MYAYGIENALTGVLQLSYLLVDFKIIWYTCQKDELRATLTEIIQI